MNIKDTLENYLYDKNYYFAIYDSFIYVHNYKKIITLNYNLISLEMENFKIDFSGEKLQIIKMNKNELLIKGNITNVKKY